MSTAAPTRHTVTSTAFPDLDYLVILAGLTVAVLLLGIWGYSVLS